LARAKDLGPAIKRQVVVVRGDDDVSQQTRPGANRGSRSRPRRFGATRRGKSGKRKARDAWRPLGKSSGNERRAGLCASTVVSIARDAAVNRSAWSVSKVSIASSSCSVSRASFFDEPPNSGRR
jgi:hypothetical protein